MLQSHWHARCPQGPESARAVFRKAVAVAAFFGLVAVCDWKTSHNLVSDSGGTVMSFIANARKRCFALMPAVGIARSLHDTKARKKEVFFNGHRRFERHWISGADSDLWGFDIHYSGSYTSRVHLKARIERRINNCSL